MAFPSTITLQINFRQGLQSKQVGKGHEQESESTTARKQVSVESGLGLPRVLTRGICSNAEKEKKKYLAEALRPRQTQQISARTILPAWSFDDDELLGTVQSRLGLRWLRVAKMIVNHFTKISRCSSSPGKRFMTPSPAPSRPSWIASVSKKLGGLPF